MTSGLSASGAEHSDFNSLPHKEVSDIPSFLPFLSVSLCREEKEKGGMKEDKTTEDHERKISLSLLYSLCWCVCQLNDDLNFQI